MKLRWIGATMEQEGPVGLNCEWGEEKHDDGADRK